tara:strand:+ start:3333 stop:3518 length:186 start_codon:yes stop_codon:yes gene_type:complete
MLSSVFRAGATLRGKMFLNYPNSGLEETFDLLNNSFIELQQLLVYDMPPLPLDVWTGKLLL